MTDSEIVSARRRWIVLVLWGFIGLLILLRIYIIVGWDHQILWNVITAAGFVEWPTIALGIVLSEWPLLLAILLVITWTASLADPKTGPVTLFVIPLCAVAGLVLGSLLCMVLYLIFGWAAWYAAPNFKNEHAGWKTNVGGFAVVAAVISGAFLLQSSDKGWAPIEACNSINGTKADGVRVLPFKQDGTSAVSLELDNKHVVRADDCQMSGDNSVYG